MSHFAKALIGAASLAFFLMSPGAQAHEGHGDEGPPQPAAAATPRVAAEGSELELVAAADGHVLIIFLDRIATNEPVEGARIEVIGEGITEPVAREMGDGVYAIQGPWVDAPGSKPLTFAVTAGGTGDLLAGVLVTPAAEEHAAAEPSLWRRPEVWLGFAVSALAGFFLAFAFRPLRLPRDERQAAPGAPEARSLPPSALALLLLAALAFAAGNAGRAVAHEGHDHGAQAPTAAGGIAPVKLPTGEVYLPKATQRLLKVRTQVAAIATAQSSKELVGTVIADPAHEGRVQAPMDGQIELAEGELSYVGKRVEAGEILALLSPAMPVYERGTLQQVTADVEGKLRIAEQKLARLSRMSGDYIPQREIDDTRTEIESLREQKRVLEPKAAERIELKAPVAGIISVANVRAGQVVNARDTLFEVVDPQKIWIEAIGSAGSDDQAPVTEATAVDAEGHRIALLYIGRAPSLRQQALPLLFKVEEPHASLVIGATVKVLVRHGTPVEGVIVPGAAVVRAANGMHQVWVKVAPERFLPKPVRAVPLDGERVAVTAGIDKGDRVVVDAAEIINQVR